jgi:hypothetical protein
VVDRLMALVGDEIAGDPVRDERWIVRSLRKLRRALARSGHELSPMTLRRLLLANGIRPRANVKHLAPNPHPDRDRQFRYLTACRHRFDRRGEPVVSVDAKNRELIGPFARRGQTWAARPPEVYSYDFPDFAEAKAIPYGVYDVRHNHAWLGVTLGKNTPDLAVDTLERWWRRLGRRAYPEAKRLLILADGGGSNGYRSRQWKWRLQQMANREGLTITVCHYPPGGSKWNPIEHLVFSQISQTWAGMPLTSVALMMAALRSTQTKTGLRVSAYLMRRAYPDKVSVSKEQWKQLHITRPTTCPLWNYTLTPW